MNPHLASIERGQGPSVVLLHGQPGTGASWDPVTELLAVDHHVLAPDRPGYGKTPGEARGLSDNADAIATLIRLRCNAPVTVVAHSWSGGAAVLMADRHPELVQSLVLVGAACTPDSLNALDRWLTVPALGDALTVLGLAGMGGLLPRVRPLTRYAPSRFRDRLEVALPDQGVAGSDRGALGRHRRTFMIEQRALVDELPTVATILGSLAVPVDVVSGEWDLVVPPRASATLARAVPGATLTLIPRAGHFVARDAPSSLVDAIRRCTGVEARER
jgi:pimeloyl-ACP methyl ester carboxylesterase